MRHLHWHAQLLAKPDLQGVEPRIIFGHDRTTGIHARHLRASYYGSAKLAQIIHMNPEDSQKYRPDREGGEKKQAAQECCVDGADLILGVGPKLTRHAELLARNAGTPVSMLVPDATILQNAQAITRRVGASGYVNFTGRLEDPQQKGLDLLGAAWKKLREEQLPAAKLQIVVRGTNDGQAERLDDWFHERPICREFAVGGDMRRKDLAQADLAVMPSRGEGFGLVALEAVYCDTPVLMNGDSGMAELIGAAWPGCTAIVKDATSEAWCLAMARVLRDPTPCFKEATELRIKLEDYLAVEKIESKALAAINALL